MRRLLLSIAITGSMSGAAVADDPVNLTLINLTRSTVSFISIYPQNADGTVVDDNLGSWDEPVFSGATVIVALSLTRCGLVRVYLQINGGVSNGGTEFDTPVDLCKRPTLTISD